MEKFALATWHFLITAFQVALTYMGTTWIAVVIAVFVSQRPFILAFRKGGLHAMRAHWKAEAAQSIRVVLSAWAFLFMAAGVNTIYIDHTSARAKIAILNDKIVALNNEIDGPIGYKKQISDTQAQFSANVKNLVEQLDEIKKQLECNCSPHLGERLAG